jgi:ABC-type multidrug transport system fused ATPase/permease subunit
LEFKNVKFAYPSRPDAPAIKEVSFRLEAGKKLALVGPSGAGKSTLAGLLLRFYAPESGQILAGGEDIQSLDLHQWRKQTALVPQDITLFGGSIFDNIAYGKPGSTQEEVEEAARKANAHEFIQALPDSYQTLVGERGIKLSGGQRQRVAIARAILRNPRLLILDEATSSLDSESERQVQDALNVLMEGRTSIIIAHRLSTVRDADQIVVLDQGIVAESGTHAELMEIEGGLYRNLKLLQVEDK